MATHKVEELLLAGARIQVIALRASPPLRELAATGSIELEERAFMERDVEGTWFVVSATNDSATNRSVELACTSRQIFICSVDDLAHSTAYFGSIIRRAPFMVAISSGGDLPAMTRLLREMIEGLLPEEKWITTARELRKQWRSEAVPMADRFQRLVRSIVARLPAEDEEPGAK